MQYIESPQEYEPGQMSSIFLAGGITGCPDWQRETRHLLQDENIVLLNPRRTNFPIHDPGVAPEQITWEYVHLRLATAVLFWFPCETLCPLTLYEFGAWSMTRKPLFIGVHPEYARRQDVEIQTELVRPGVEIVYSLEKLRDQVRRWIRKEQVMTEEEYWTAHAEVWRLLDVVPDTEEGAQSAEGQRLTALILAIEAYNVKHIDPPDEIELHQSSRRKR